MNGLPALAAIAILAAACSPAPAPATPRPSHASRSATPSPTPTQSPLPLDERRPCDLLSRQDKARLKAASSEFEEKPENLSGYRTCQYDVTRAADGTFFTLSFMIVEHEEPPEPVEPLARFGHHRGAFTKKDRNGYDATYSILVTKRSRVDVYFVAGTYAERAEVGAVQYARLIEPRLP